MKGTKTFFIFLLALAAFLLLLIVVAPLYLNTQPVKNKINTQLSQQLGTPVSLGMIYCTPWHGVSVATITFGTQKQQNKLQINNLHTSFLRVCYILHPLLKKQPWKLRLKASSIGINNQKLLRHCCTTLCYNPKSIKFSKTTAHIAQGTLQGEIEIKTTIPGYPYQLKAQINQLSLPQLVTQTAWEKHITAGTLHASLQAHGNLKAAPHLEGEGNLFLEETSIQPSELITECAHFLQLKQLETLQIHEAHADFLLNSHQMRIKNMEATMDGLILKANGNIDLHGALEARARLLIDQRLADQVAILLNQKPAPSSKNGYYEVPFHVGGSLQNIQTDLINQQILQGAQQGLGQLLRSFF